MSANNQKSRFSRAALTTGGVLLMVVLGGSVESYVAGWFGSSDSSDGAHWIWSPSIEFESKSTPTPSAFFAVLDFELEEPDSVFLSLMADEVYVLFINGRPVGSGGYRPGIPLDRYRLDPVVRVGANRAIVELRSSRGAGGLLAVLRAGDPERLISKSGSSWKIVDRYDPAIFAGDELPENLATPRDWGAPPSGRWKLGAGSTDRSLRGDVFPPTQHLFPLRARPGPFVEGTDVWVELPDAPESVVPRASTVLLDWGREVAGALTIELGLRARHQGLVYLGTEPPDPSGSQPAFVVSPFYGRGWWRAALDHKFRYVLLVGVEYRGLVWVEESQETDSLEPWSPIWDRGLDPGPTDVMLEREVWVRVGLPPPRDK